MHTSLKNQWYSVVLDNSAVVGQILREAKGESQFWVRMFLRGIKQTTNKQNLFVNTYGGEQNKKKKKTKIKNKQQQKQAKQDKADATHSAKFSETLEWKCPSQLSWIEEKITKSLHSLFSPPSPSHLLLVFTYDNLWWLMGHSRKDMTLNKGALCSWDHPESDSWRCGELRQYVLSWRGIWGLLLHIHRNYFSPETDKLSLAITMSPTFILPKLELIFT